MQAATRVADLADRPAKVVGVVRALGEPLLAPLTGTPCVYFRAIARRFREMEEQVAQDFWLDGGRGSVVVRMARFRIFSAPAPVWPYRRRERKQWEGRQPVAPEPPLPDALRAFLKRQRVRIRRGFHFSEETLAIGETIAVFGVPTGPPPADSGYRGPPTQRILQAPPYGHLLISDLPEHLS
jgi:hypothetical protein